MGNKTYICTLFNVHGQKRLKISTNKFEREMTNRFIGDYGAKTDAKGRVFLPAPFRKVLEAEGEKSLVLRNDVFQKCLVLYPESVWNEQLDALAARIAHDVNEYLEVAAGIKLVDEERMTGEEVRELADELAPLMDLLKDAKITVKKTPHSKTIKVNSPEAVFAKFFKELGL